MKLHFFSLAGMLFGITIIASSFVRWYIIYPDLSSFLFGTSVGCLVTFIAYIYNWMRQVDDTLKEHYLRFEAMAAKVFNVQDDHIDNEIRGRVE